MQLYDDITTVAAPPALPAAGTPGYFTDGVPGSVPRTLVRAWWLNLVARELMSILAAGGITPDRTATNQVLLAIQALLATAIAPLATTSALNAETTRAEGAEAANATAISTEATNRGIAVAGEATARGIADGAIVTAAQAGSYIYGADSSGAANSVLLALTPALAAYAAGQAFKVKIAHNNTGAGTLNVNGLGAKSILWNQRPLVGGELLAGNVVELVYDGTAFQIQGLAAITGSNANGHYRIGQDGLIEQWLVYPSAVAAEGPFALNYPISFASVVLGLSTITNNPSSNAGGSTTFQVVGPPGLSASTFYAQDQSGTFTDASGGFFAKVEGY